MKSKKVKKTKKVRKTPKLRKKVLIKKKITKVKEFSSQEFFKAKIRVIGIGGGGGSIVSEIGKSLGKATFVIADTDLRVFQKRQGIKYFFFGQNTTHGLGTGLNTEIAKAAAELDREKIEGLFENQDIVFLISSLG